METIRVFVLLILIRLNLSMESTPTLVLNNGLKIPKIALGTYLGLDENGIMQSQNHELRDAVITAIDLGFRHIDTASVYTTEKEVGEAVKLKIEKGDIKREDVFICTKLWNTDHKKDQVEPALRESLRNLGMNYVDLYLMHWPMAIDKNQTFLDVDYLETWQAMEEVQKLGLAKSIGVSNFNMEQLKRVIDNCKIMPAVIQVEVHAEQTQKELVKFCEGHGIVVMAYSPFGSLVPRFGAEKNGPHIDNPVLQKIAAKYGKTTPQVLLRWHVDRNIIPTPKALKTAHLKSNIEIFDFKLTDEEIAEINNFEAGVRYILPSFWQNHTYYPFEKIDNPIPNPFRNDP